tara:strand:- start:1525 stop:2625 length:1101 start_codon:yes stop_codon:yes gene_type:complete
MIDTKKFFNLLKRKNINFFSGVPDSCLNEFCNELSNHKNIQNIVAANEGSAVSLGIGYNLATSKIPCIYMQNSGLGNATDPLTNLISKTIYDLPIILLIGWRGAPSIKDEAQHDIQGKVLLDSLKLFQIKNIVMESERDLNRASKLIDYAKKNSARVALIFKPKTLTKIKHSHKKNKNKISREEFILGLLKAISKKTKIISSVGFNSRELFFLREREKIKNGKDFLMVGGMGHTAMTALSMSKFSRNKIICLDGDGSFIMHMGALSILNNFKAKNFKYILIDNEAHESIGMQPIFINKMNFKNLSKSFGFKNYYLIENKKDINTKIKNFLKNDGPSFLHVKVKVGTIQNLPRPKNFLKIKKNFLKI